ncbi:MAG: pyridoxamine 5'-phosphate oxidase family protein [Oscillospiraceae bacterium]|nr:pyridoxamine 5'-phosphate oxidase family protein [Oscillospiraceae bacterium]
MFREMRRNQQEVSQQECIAVLKSEKRGVLAVLGDNNYPYAVPMNFYYDEQENKIYLHSAKSGHKLDAIQNCDKVCFTTWNQGIKKQDDWAFYVTSVIIMGKAELIHDENLKMKQVKNLGLKYYPSEQEVQEVMRKHISNVQLIAISIDNMTGKLVHEK